MGSEIFAVFVRTVEGIPAKAVLRAIELERWLIQDDLVHQRALSIHDAASILCFCNFLSAAKSGGEVHPSVLPVEHLPFYRQTVERLVEAGELPSSAMAQFDIAFSYGFLTKLAA